MKSATIEKSFTNSLMPNLTVTYESGFLKPTVPINFPEGKVLQVHILEPDSNPETELLSKIHRSLPENLYQRLTPLIQKRDNNQLTLNEQQELIQLTHEVERLNVDRITYLIELAKYRQTTLPEVIRDLGLKPIEYV